MRKPLVYRVPLGPQWERRPSGLFWIPRRIQLAKKIVLGAAQLNTDRWRFFDLDNASFDSCTLLGTGDETGSTGNADFTLNYSGGGDPGVGLRYQVISDSKSWAGTVVCEYDYNTTGFVSAEEGWLVTPFGSGDEVAPCGLGLSNT